MRWTPPSASGFSETIDLMLKYLSTVSTILVSLVLFLMIFFCIKYRAGSKADRSSPPARNLPLEMTLISTIFILGISLFAWASHYYYQMYVPPKDAIEINVIAKQWMWIFHDVHGPDQINSFKVPLGKPVKLLMTSEDVVHSFFVPAFRVKQDVVPGTYTSLWFTPTKLGRFIVLCSQYCGLSHSQMRATVEVITPEAYDAFVKQNKPLAAFQKGAELYTQKGCISCHEGNHSIGPSLNSVFGSTVVLNNGQRIIANEDYLRRAILQPNAEVVQGYQGLMPTFQGLLTEEQLFNLIHYLKSKR